MELLALQNTLNQPIGALPSTSPRRVAWICSFSAYLSLFLVFFSKSIDYVVETDDTVNDTNFLRFQALKIESKDPQYGISFHCHGCCFAKDQAVLHPRSLLRNIRRYATVKEGEGTV